MCDNALAVRLNSDLIIHTPRLTGEVGVFLFVLRADFGLSQCVRLGIKFMPIWIKKGKFQYYVNVTIYKC